MRADSITNVTVCQKHPLKMRKAKSNDLASGVYFTDKPRRLRRLASPEYCMQTSLPV
jgi:hypothetical protein